MGINAEDLRCYQCDRPLPASKICKVCDELRFQRFVQPSLEYLFRPEDLIEVRAIRKDASQPVYSGYYYDRRKMAEDIRMIAQDDSVKACYYLLNPADPVVQTKPSVAPVNDFKDYVATTRDSEILSRRWLLIDLDPEREGDTAATDEEKGHALQVMQRVGRYLGEDLDWPQPAVCDSGNGYHLLYAIDLPNSPEVADILHRCLLALAAKFNTEAVTIDTTVYNASRIVKSYGTVSRKGEASSDRPWRGSTFMKLPAVRTEVTFEQLTALASSAVAIPSASGAKHKGMPELAGDFDVEDFAEHFGLEVSNPEGEARGSETWYYLASCPVKGSPHKGQNAGKSALVVGKSLGFKCFSSDCDGFTIGKLLRLLSEQHGGYPHDIFVDKTNYTTLWGEGAFDDDEEPEVDPPIQTVVSVPAIEGTDYTTGMVDLLPETSSTRIDPASQPTDVLDMHSDCLYGWLGEKAKELQAPLGWAYVSLMTIFAAQGINEGAAESEIRPTLYTCLVGRPGDGKSRVMNRARQSLVVEPSINWQINWLRYGPFQSTAPRSPKIMATRFSLQITG